LGEKNTSTYVDLADASLNIAFLSLNRRWGAVRTGLNLAFDFYFESKSSPLHPSIASRETLTLSNFESELSCMGNNDRDFYLGKLVPRKQTVDLQANLKTRITFKVDLTFSELRQLEELKESTNIQFVTNFVFSTETAAKIKTIHKTQLKFNLSKSDWAEAFHSRMRYFNRPVFTA
jgi:hypothetical protein